MTTTRRRFIQAGMATTALVGAGPVLSRAGGSALFAEFSKPFHRVIIDERFAASREFGAEAARLGQRVQAIRGEVHRLWNEDLYYRWKESRAAVAGMTDFRSLFLLEMMAADAGLRVVYRGHHVPGATGVSHELFGPRDLHPDLAERVDSAGLEWMREVARIITDLPQQMAALPSRESDVLRARNQVLDGRAMVSWIISPRMERPA